ncbi:Sensor histidine kinase PrrB (RegB) [Enhygromyxa salina]|uniref:histidine kinase n=1 Tax=Enhygromyxa salina TaxID=215803 RepID=A0A0C2D779_9BACT|nr:HAMP domain-containing histidine kinase [Enhygromyxa salina]KIG19021.1 Sensor histidine kinase PrrB (RegB) [Enhygromyxa salina]
MMIGEQAQANARITLRNLIAARWVLIALVSASVLFAALAGDRLPVGLLPRSEHPIALVATVVVWTVLNLVSPLALARGRASEPLAGAHLLADALALTLLLALSGGPANPFTILYFLPITLATQVSPRWTWALAGVCVACFAGLFLLTPVEHEPEPAAPTTTAASEDPHAHHHMPADHAGGPAPTAAKASDRPHGEHFEGHQLGMWVAFGLVGVLITVFVHRTALALAHQRDELARLRQTTLEDRHLTALGTLAAGAAHELGTPLGTIKLLVDELPHLPAPESEGALDTIREQLARCKLIVSRMASPELRVSALGHARAQPWPLTKLVTELEGVDAGVPLRVEIDPDLESQSCGQPFSALSQVLRELLNNAADATRRAGEGDRAVVIRFDVRDAALIIDVIDRGVGMDGDELAAAFSPFHTTRPENQGMGLGLYLARAHLRQLGGTIEIDSELGRGTRVRVELPLVDRGAAA